MSQPKSYTVRSLITALQKMPPNARVRAWSHELEDYDTFNISLDEDMALVVLEVGSPQEAHEEVTPRSSGYRVEVVRGGGSARDASGRFVRSRR